MRIGHFTLTFLLLFLFGLAMTACGPANFSQTESASAAPGEDPGGDTDDAGDEEPRELCPGEKIDPDGCIKAKCIGGINDPRVEVTWCSHPNANSNSLQKGDINSTTGTFWNWIYQEPNYQGPSTSKFTYMDFDLVVGAAYHYRAKHRPELPSTNVVIVPITACSCGN